MKILLTLILAAASFAQTKVNYPTDVRNGPYASDAGPVGKTLPQLCTGAGALPLAITQRWNSVDNANYSMQRAGGWRHHPARLRANYITFTGAVSGPPVRMFDTSLGARPRCLFNTERSTGCLVR